MAHEVIRRLKLGGLCIVALSVAGCGEDKAVDRFSMTDQAWSNAFGNEAGGLPPLPQAQPMDVADAGAPAYAPPADRLPAARAIAYAQPQGDDHAWIDRADQFSDMLGDAPPDYRFAYEDGVTPWAWESGDDYARYAEPIDGGYRYYYYEPGAASPYLVRDPWNSYGYRDDRLVAVYDGGGRVLPWREARVRDGYASRYYARAVDMRRAARARERERIEARQWAARRAAIAQDRARWVQARRDQAQWREYRARQDDRVRQHWAAESRAREQAATRFANWQREDFRTPPPRFYEAQQRRVAAQDRREAVRDERQWRQTRERQVALDDRREAQQRREAQKDRRQAQAERARIAERREIDQRQVQQQRRAVQAREDRRQAQARRAEVQARQQRAERAARDNRQRAERAQDVQRAEAQRQVAQRRQQQSEQAQRRTREAAEAGRTRAEQRAQRDRARVAQAQQRAARDQARAQQAQQRAGRDEQARRQAERAAQRQAQAQQRGAARAERLAQRPDNPGRPHRND